MKGSALPLLFLLFLAGCAGWARHGVVMAPPRKLKVAVLPVLEGVKIKKLKYVMTVSTSAPAVADERAAVEEELFKARENITASLEADLAAGYFYEVIPGTAVRSALADMNVCVSTCVPDSRQVRALGRALGADVVLSAKLSGYGRVKDKWIMLLIASGVVEGGVQGFVAAKLVHNTWVAVAVAAEEIGQETLTWWGGSFLLGKVFSPVILEGKLTSASDGAVIWSKTSFSTLDKKGLEKYPEAEQAKKELRLKVTAEAAAKELIKSLQEKTAKNIP
jgi:hypothetical protein